MNILSPIKQIVQLEGTLVRTDLALKINRPAGSDSGTDRSFQLQRSLERTDCPIK